MTPKRKWQVWTEAPGKDDTVVFEGSESKARQFYKKNGGSKAGLHLGYVIPEDTEEG